jgi:SAM-dependent methyltransferase
MPLAYYARAATQEFWAEHWGGQDVAGLLAVARRSPLTRLVERGLPPGGLVLEAGAGLGQYVILLRERGRRAVGVDWSRNALARGRAAAPGLPVAAMDLGALGIRDGAVAAYLSLGVLEHDPAGPARLLAEARRVLASGGRLLVSVPYVNGARRLLRPWLARRQRRLAGAGGAFYQYAFTREEVRGFLGQAGFRVLWLAPYDPARMLRGAARALGAWRRPSPVGAAVTAAGRGDGAGAAQPQEPGAVSGGMGRSGGAAGLARRLLYTPPALRLLGHMILAVAERP